MSYTITVRVFQTNPSSFFEIIEKCVFNFGGGGAWTESNDQHVLRLNASGTCGTIRFESADRNERFIVALGVHNYARWCDVVTGLVPHDTGVVITPEWYGAKRSSMREKTLKDYSVKSTTGRNIEVKYTVTDGHELKADIIIG